MKAIKYEKFRSIWPVIPAAEQAWRALRNTKPLVIEIGPGVGMHPIQYAHQYPAKYIIAIEKTREKFGKFAVTHAQHPELTNLLPVHANAMQWITQNIGAEEVSEYFLLYPNPYPKAAQKNKRLHNMPFMEHLLATMHTGATLTIATNMEFFHLEALAQLSISPQLQLSANCNFTAQTHTGRTHFETKYLQRGHTCYQLVFTKL